MDLIKAGLGRARDAALAAVVEDVACHGGSGLAICDLDPVNLEISIR